MAEWKNQPLFMIQMSGINSVDSRIMATSLPLQASIYESERGKEMNHYDEHENRDKESNPLQMKAHALERKCENKQPKSPQYKLIIVLRTSYHEDAHPCAE